MSNKDNGGPAFPSQYNIPENQGMTLRDYFAAKAMQGLLAGPMDAELKEFAEWSYRIADAMLEARK